MPRPDRVVMAAVLVASILGSAWVIEQFVIQAAAVWHLAAAARVAKHAAEREAEQERKRQEEERKEAEAAWKIYQAEKEVRQRHEALEWQERQDACKRDFKVMPQVEWKARWRDFCRQAVEADAKSGTE